MRVAFSAIALSRRRKKGLFSKIHTHLLIRGKVYAFLLDRAETSATRSGSALPIFDGGVASTRWYTEWLLPTPGRVPRQIRT